MRAGTVLSRPLMCFPFDARPPDLPAELARPLIAGGAGAELLELGERVAQAGHHAIAIDSFGRTAGLWPRDEAFD